MSNIEVQLINEELLRRYHKKAAESVRLRQNFDPRTTVEDGGQRMLNAVAESVAKAQV